MRFDHVIIAALDLDATASRLIDQFGLGSTVGGEHPGIGTANRIAPLGAGYLELMGIADRGLAEQNPLGRRVIERDGRWLGWCLGTDDIDAVTRRLDLACAPMSRRLPGGGELSWRLAGLDRALAQPELPFFIQWDDPARNPGLGSAPHRIVPQGIEAVEVAGDASLVREWLGSAELPVELVDGDAPGLQAVQIGTVDGPPIEIRL